MAATLSKIFQLSAGLLFVLLQLNPPRVHAEITPPQRLTNPANSSPIPDSLKVPGEQQLIAKISAKGTQIYVCTKSADYPIQYKWELKAPDAVLFNEQGQAMGKHYAGPTWEAKDGSQVMALIKAKANAPQNSAIPWLLLKAKSHEGTGIFRQVNWIQRVNTVGGKAPVGGCDESTQNREISVNYTADYWFYGDKNTAILGV